MTSNVINRLKNDILNRAAAKYLLKTGEFLAWAFIFALAYSQSVLYTSNQNQYFLHGLAKAGFGYLREDWLANTQDPTPLFSLLVYMTYHLLRSEVVFYLYYPLLMGVYLYSIVGIVKQVIPGLVDSRVKILAFYTLVVVIHSAAIRYLLLRGLGTNWEYLLEGGVAGQRLLGNVLQPSCFGVFLVFSIYLFLRGRPFCAVTAGMLAAAFHPTYLLSAAFLTTAYMLVTYLEHRDFHKPLYLGLLALLLVSPIVAYVYATFWGSDPAATAQARDIMANYRLPHHTWISQWFDLSVIVQVLLVLAALYILRKSRLFWIMLLPFLMMLALTLLQVFLQNDNLALLFPWRFSVVLVPLSTCIVTAGLLSKVFERLPSEPALLSIKQDKFMVGFCSVILLGLMIVGVFKFSLDLREKQSSPERAMMSFMAQNKSHGQSYLIPIKMQDFRLATGAPVFIEYKSIPYTDREVLEWYSRILKASRFYRTTIPNTVCDLLARFAMDYGITHVVLENGYAEPPCLSGYWLYGDRYYTVYKLPYN